MSSGDQSSCKWGAAGGGEPSVTGLYILMEWLGQGVKGWGTRVGTFLVVIIREGDATGN